MSTPIANESTRRRLTATQADTVARLTAAAVELISEDGFEALTVRLVAKRAGVAPATAYTYFSSKNHLVAEAFWRRLAESVDDPNPKQKRTNRVVSVLRQVSLLVAGESEFAHAVTVALLGSDPDVEHLRIKIGVLIRQKLARALNPADPEDIDGLLVESLEMLYSGALMTAGMGYVTYEHIADRLAQSATLLLEGHD
jgi:AcrR family transcriptional regulator